MKLLETKALSLAAAFWMAMTLAVGAHDGPEHEIEELTVRIKSEGESADLLLQRAIELDPKFLMALNNRASAYMGLGQWAKAAGDYARIVELEPQNDGARLNLCSCYVQLGRTNEAIAQFEQVLLANPDPGLRQWVDGMKAQAI